MNFSLDFMHNLYIAVIASAAKQSSTSEYRFYLDCHGDKSPRNDSYARGLLFFRF